jgi:hypothetical protein
MMPTIPPVLDREGRKGLLTRLRRMLGWAASLTHTTARYMLYRVPLFARGRRGGMRPDPPDLDRVLPGDPDGVQRAAVGHGPLYHRSYRIAFTDADLDATQLIRRLRGDLNAATPSDLARFEPMGQPLEDFQDADEGPACLVEVGREYLVHLPGPWNGPVRVVEVDDTSFTFVTLKGHMEAGQITFRAMPHPEYDWVVFEIESFARCGSRMFDLLYHRLPLGREMQLHMWSSFCHRVAQLAGGVVMTSVEVETNAYADDQLDQEAVSS